jgi:hypothetical protein
VLLMLIGTGFASGVGETLSMTTTRYVGGEISLL